MSHLNGISEEQYIFGINSAWQLYKKLQHNFPERFKEYIADSKYKTRLSYNKNDDRWYLLKVSFPNGILNLTQKKQTHENSITNTLRHQNSSSINNRSSCTMRYLLQRTTSL